MSSDPLALGARLEQDPGSRSIAEHRGQAFAARSDAPFGRRTVRSEDAELTLALVQIHPYRVHRRLASVWVRLDRVDAFASCGAEHCYHVFPRRSSRRFIPTSL